MVESAVAGPATLRIRAGGEVVAEQQVALQQGRQTFSFPLTAESDGFVRYAAEIEVPNDDRRQNNEAAALVDVQGEPRVLLVEGTPGDARNLADALAAANMNPTTVAPGATVVGFIFAAVSASARLRASPGVPSTSSTRGSP